MTSMLEKTPHPIGVQVPRSRAAAISTGAGILFWPAGLVLGIVGWRHTKPGGKRGRGWAISGIAVSATFGLLWSTFLVAGLSGALDEAPSAAAHPAAASTAPSSPKPSAVASSPAPVKSSAPVVAAPPPAPVDPVSVTRAAILAAIGTPQQGRPRPSVMMSGARGEEIVVSFPAADNITQGFIVTGMATITTDILKAVRADAGWDYRDLRVTATFPMTNQLGQSGEGRIFSATYSKDIVDTIDFSGFNYRNIGAIGSDVFEDPVVMAKLN